MSRQSASVRLEAADFERVKLVALVDRRSISEVVADCVTRALPALEAELQRPRLSPEMVARIKAGETLDQIINTNLAPFAPGALNETPPPYRANLASSDPLQVAATSLLQAATDAAARVATPAPTPPIDPPKPTSAPPLKRRPPAAR